MSLYSAIPYVPTPKDVVFKMLELAEVKTNEVVIDAGAGDCRIVVIAALHFEAIGIGIEKNPVLVKECLKLFEKYRLKGRAYIVYGDLLEFNYSIADVVTLYLGTEMNEKLKPKLERELKPGTRVVSHDFEVPGWKPEKIVEIEGPLRKHKIYLYYR